VNRKQLMQTCVWVDEQTKTCSSVAAQVEEELGLEPGSISYVASQRALLNVLRSRGQPIPETSQAVELSAAESELHRILMLIYIDGLMTGVYAQKYQGALPQ
jgi:hypothetical protein